MSSTGDLVAEATRPRGLLEEGKDCGFAEGQTVGLDRSFQPLAENSVLVVGHYHRVNVTFLADRAGVPQTLGHLIYGTYDIPFRLRLGGECSQRQQRLGGQNR